MMSEQTEVSTPSTEKVNAALKVAKAKKGKATKEGTTAEAKRPSKAKVTKPEPEPEPPKKAKGKKVAEEEAPAPKGKAKSAGKTSSRGSIDETMKIKVKKPEGARREGTAVYENWLLVKKYNGKTVGAYLAAGGRLDSLKKEAEVLDTIDLV